MGNANLDSSVRAVGWLRTAYVILALVPACNVIAQDTGESGFISKMVVWPWTFDDDTRCVLKEIGESFGKALPKTRMGLVFGADDRASLARFADTDDPFAVVVCNQAPGRRDLARLERRFHNIEPQVKTFVIGQRRLIVIASKDLRVKRISLLGLQWLLRESEAGWPSSESEEKQRRSLKLSTTDGDSWCNRFLRSHCMEYERQEKGVTEKAEYHFRNDLRRVRGNARDVIALVQRENRSIGFVAYEPTLDFSGVDVLEVRDHWRNEWVKPSVSPVIQKDYCFSETLCLYLHPLATPEAEEFCRYAVGQGGEEIIKKVGFTTPAMQWRAEVSSRIGEIKSGKCPKLAAVSYSMSQASLLDLAMEFVKAKASAQISCTNAGTDVPATAAFVGGKELLFLAGRPGEQAIRTYGRAWRELGPNGAGPQEYVLAGRAVAVVVNPASKLTSLSVEQMRGMFSGEVGDWAAVGDTGFPVPMTAGGKAVAIPIKAYGLRTNDPAGAPFFKNCLAADKLERVVLKKDSAEVIAAVSMDPQAIGFVDLTAIPAGSKGIKVLGIRVESGKAVGGTPSPRRAATQPASQPAELIIQPTPENVVSGAYPLTERLYLYVHPKASDTAKDFAKFLATCGQSAANPYMDVEKSVQEAFRKNGYIALPPPKPVVVRPPKKIDPVAVLPKDKPTTRPTTEPVRPDPKREYPKEPVASADSLIDALLFTAPLPPHQFNSWAKMSEAKKQETWKAYQGEVVKWQPKADLKGKAVTWDLKISRVSKSEEDNLLTVSATSAEGYMVTFEVAEEGNGSLLAKKKGAAVSVKGKIDDYTVSIEASPLNALLAPWVQIKAGILLENAQIKK